MPPVIRLAATIPYEIASDIEYAERRLDSFDRLAFRDHKRAVENIARAVDAYGRLWGRLVGGNGFVVDQCYPFPIRPVRTGSYVPAALPADPIVEKAVEVAVVLAEFYANPLASGTGVDKATLRSEMVRRDRLAYTVKTLGDLLRDRVQQDYIRLHPSDWVRAPFRGVVGRVAAVRHSRVRVTTAERCSNLNSFSSDHRYTTWDLVRETLEAIPPPSPLPLCVPGLEWFRKAVEAQRELDFRYEQKWSRLLEIRTHSQRLAFAIEMLFLSEQPSEIMNAWTEGRHTFPEEHCAYFPDWIEGRLRTHYGLVGEIQKLERQQGMQFDSPPWDRPPRVVQALVELGRETIEVLAPYIADQVGRELGASIRVHGDYAKTLPEDIFDSEIDNVSLEGRWATLVKQCDRTLIVEFDPDEELLGLHEVDITDVTA